MSHCALVVEKKGRSQNFLVGATLPLPVPIGPRKGRTEARDVVSKRALGAWFSSSSQEASEEAVESSF